VSRLLVRSGEIDGEMSRGSELPAQQHPHGRTIMPATYEPFSLPGPDSDSPRIRGRPGLQPPWSPAALVSKLASSRAPASAVSGVEATRSSGPLCRQGRLGVIYAAQT
jgi:hypothetical protein